MKKFILCIAILASSLSQAATLKTLVQINAVGDLPLIFRLNSELIKSNEWNCSLNEKMNHYACTAELDVIAIENYYDLSIVGGQKPSTIELTSVKLLGNKCELLSSPIYRSSHELGARFRVNVELNLNNCF